MKKVFRNYAIGWVILLIVYNVVVFTVRPIMDFTLTYDARFWISWAFVMAAFAGQLACAFAAFRAKTAAQFFLNIPLITISYTSTILMTIAGSVCMLIPDCPAWITAVVCTLLFGFSAVSVVKAQAAAEVVADVEKKVKAQTFFIQSLTLDAQDLVEKAQNEEVRAELKKVYEAIRYSDPMSSDQLAAAESQITLAFAGLREAVAAGDSQQVKQKANDVLILVKERNSKCKLLK